MDKYKPRVIRIVIKSLWASAIGVAVLKVGFTIFGPHSLDSLWDKIWPPSDCREIYASWRKDANDSTSPVDVSDGGNVRLRLYGNIDEKAVRKCTKGAVWISGEERGMLLTARLVGVNSLSFSVPAAMESGEIALPVSRLEPGEQFLLKAKWRGVASTQLRFYSTQEPPYCGNMLKDKMTQIAALKDSARDLKLRQLAHGAMQCEAGEESAMTIINSINSSDVRDTAYSDVVSQAARV